MQLLAAVLVADTYWAKDVLMGFSRTIIMTQVKLDKNQSLDKILRVYKQQDTPEHYN